MNSFSKPRIYSLLSRNLVSQQRQTRAIVTESWLDSDVNQRKRQEFLSSCGNVSENFKIIRENYEKRGIEALSQSQILKFIGKPIFRFKVTLSEGDHTKFYPAPVLTKYS